MKKIIYKNDKDIRIDLFVSSNTSYSRSQVSKLIIKGMIKKNGLAVSKSSEKISNEEIAKLTLKCLKDSVPKEVPGIAFLSGGQTEIEAAENLNLINKYNDTNFIMTYSYGRALQAACLKAWSGNSDNLNNAQKVFAHRCKCNSAARNGSYSEKTEQEISVS